MTSRAQNKLIIWATVLLCGIVFFISIAILRPWYTPDEPAQRIIKVGYLPIYVDLPVFVAVERGFLDKRFEGTNYSVSLERFESSPDMAAALVGGRIDAVASIATQSALSIETRDPGKFKIFLVDAETPQNPLSSLIASSSSNIKTVADLKGKVIGSFPGPTARIWGPMALEKLGLKQSDYTMQELPIGSHTSALETNRIDAVITYEPTATQLVEKYGSNVLAKGLIETNIINPWQAGIWIISTEFIRESKIGSDLFVLGIYDAVDFIRKDPVNAKESLLKYTTIEKSIALKTPDIPFTKVGVEIDDVTLQRHADILYDNGMLSDSISVPSLLMAPPFDEQN